jgi:uncharacterized protein (DUF4415 family)
MASNDEVPKDFELGKGYSKDDWDAVDSPHLTDEELAHLRPAREVLPPSFFKGVQAARRKAGRPPVEKPKKAVTLRVDPDVIESFQRQGKDWRARMSAALRKSAGV